MKSKFDLSLFCIISLLIVISSVTGYFVTEDFGYIEKNTKDLVTIYLLCRLIAK